MRERIFNLFYFVENNEICQLGYVEHALAGTDEEKLYYLRRSVEVDLPNATKTLPSKKLTLQRFMALSRQGRALEVFEEIFQKLDARADPLCCITAVVDGKPEIDISTPHEPFLVSKYQGHPKLGGGIMSDYLEDYMKPEGFDMPSLINDDYFDAIKILFNKGCYVSSMKLLASFIDTLAFLEHGDTPRNFVKWLEEYAELDRVGITPSQLWELRNSILHMTNLDSRRVLKGEEKRISFCVATGGFTPEDDHENSYFNLLDLINVIASALTKWIGTFNQRPEKITTFIERYDRVLSDNRHAILRR
ncbi:MAG: hypothetical protein ACQEUG_14725 [Pseudomonadota bacterium]